MAEVLNTLDPTGVPTLIGRQDWKKNLNFMRYILAQPLKSFQNITLVGPDDAISQDNFGTTKVLSVGGARRTGDIIGLQFHTFASLSLSGTIILEAFDIQLFKANPALTVNAVNVGNQTISSRVNRVTVVAADWEVRTAVEGFGSKDMNVPFETSNGGTLWIAMRHKGSTQWNSAATANERMAVGIYMRMDL